MFRSKYSIRDAGESEESQQLVEEVIMRRYKWRHKQGLKKRSGICIVSICFTGSSRSDPELEWRGQNEALGDVKYMLEGIVSDAVE